MVLMFQSQKAAHRHKVLRAVRIHMNKFICIKHIGHSFWFIFIKSAKSDTFLSRTKPIFAQCTSDIDIVRHTNKHTMYHIYIIAGILSKVTKSKYVVCREFQFKVPNLVKNQDELGQRHDPLANLTLRKPFNLIV